MWTTLETYGRRLLQDLPALMPYILVAIGLLVVLILARLFVVLWARKRVSAPADAEDTDSADAAAASARRAAGKGIRDSFRAAMQQLRRLMHKRGYHLDWVVRLMGHSYRYELPWFAVLGEEGSGKTTLLDHLPLDTPVPPVRTDDSPAAGCNWWFYNQALVVDVPGRVLHRPDGDADDEAWSQVVNQLRTHRSRQPLNGVVLTLPCPDLVGPEALSTADIEAKAARLHNKLRDLQRVLGLRLPVYVVLTKGDAVPGFRSFCDEVPDERTDDMLGWSNPYAVDAAYTSEWAEEAVEALRDDLQHAQLRALSDDIQTGDPDAFFLFPDRLQEAKDGLATYLDELFAPSAYHEGFMLRGVYLTGDRTPPSGIEEAAGPTPDADPHPAFLKDLFRSKIFEEWTLARPVATAQSWQQRATRAAQGGVAVLTVLGLFGLWYAGSNLQDQHRAVASTLTDAQASIERVGEWQKESGGSGGDDALSFRQTATSLLQNTSTATSIDLTSVLIPASWVSSVEGHVDEAIAATYDKVILRAMRSALHDRADRLVAGGLRSGEQAAAGADTLTLGAMPSYQAWQGYTQDLAALERAAEQYRRLDERPDLDAFAGVSDYLFDVDIQSSLDRSPDVYRRALGNVRPDPVRLQSVRASATEKMRRHAGRFNDALPRQYGVLARLRQLADQIDRLGTFSVGDEGGNRQEDASLRSVHSGIARVQTVLERPESRWLTSDTLALETVYGPFLAFADTSALVAPGVSEDLRAEGTSAIARLQDRLAGVQSSMTGPLLRREDGQVRRAWASDVGSLREAIGQLLDQPFMQPTEDSSPLRSTVPEGRRLQWNRQELRRIEQHIQVYDSVTTQGLSQFPPPMQRTVRQVAAAGLDDHLRNHLGRAQSFVLDVPSGAVGRREAQVQQRADRFRDALSVLNTVLTIQGELNMDASRRQLAQVTAEEADALIDEVDQLLREKNLYGVGGSAFAQWDGRRSPSLALVNARDSQQVQRYLDVQREQMRFLGETLAGPALSFLSQWDDQIPLTRRPLVAKWQGIRHTLRQYESKTAGNALAAYESFVTSEIHGVDPVEYVLRMSPAEVSEQSSDFFLQRRNAIRRQLYERSRTLALRRAQREYARLAAFFNEQLSGRFPFASLDAGPAQDAPPSAVRRLYEQYDRYVSTYRPVLRTMGEGEQAQEFLDGVGSARPFVAAVLDRPSDYPLPTVDVVPDFRVNRDREQLGEQIIGWRMDVGGDRVAFGQSDTLHWAAGDSVQVRLRWAADAPTRPVDAARGTVDPQAGTVMYRYGGQWALLRLLRRHEAPPRAFSRRVDPNPYTLRLTAETQGEGPSQAHVFVRQRLYRAGTADRITATPAVPRQAPPFAADSSEAP
jgi:type VI secretion system protein ImpL